jgi:hypothetical protein
MPKTPTGGHDDVSGQCEQKTAGDPACGVLGGFRKRAAMLQLDERRQISTPAEASSIRLSMPKAVRLMLCAAIPEAMAIMDSTVIHATVNHSRGSALRVRHPDYRSARAGVPQRFSAITLFQEINL